MLALPVSHLWSASHTIHRNGGLMLTFPLTWTRDHTSQGALEDRLAHVTVERDAYAAQLADLRRYQVGRVVGAGKHQC